MFIKMRVQVKRMHYHSVKQYVSSVCTIHYSIAVFKDKVLVFKVPQFPLVSGDYYGSCVW